MQIEKALLHISALDKVSKFFMPYDTAKTSNIVLNRNSYNKHTVLFPIREEKYLYSHQ